MPLGQLCASPHALYRAKPFYHANRRRNKQHYGDDESPDEHEDGGERGQNRDEDRYADNRKEAA